MAITYPSSPHSCLVIPAKAGIHVFGFVCGRARRQAGAGSCCGDLLRRLPCGARARGGPHNSLLSLRSFRSDKMRPACGGCVLRTLPRTLCSSAPQKSPAPAGHLSLHRPCLHSKKYRRHRRFCKGLGGRAAARMSGGEARRVCGGARERASQTARQRDQPTCSPRLFERNERQREQRVTRRATCPSTAAQSVRSADRCF